MGANIHRLKSTFTSGEISPLLGNRTDFDRFQNGCKVLKNAACLTQGPAQRRSGFEFIYDLTSLDMDTSNPSVRMIPFIFNELQAYVLIFFEHDTSGEVRMVMGAQDGGLVVYPDPVPPCPTSADSSRAFTGPATFNMTGDVDYAAEVYVEHVETTGVVTVLSESTDYTVTINTTPTVDQVVVTWSGSTTGTLNIYLRPNVSVGDIVYLEMPSGFDIDGFDYAQSADELYIAQSGINPLVITRYSHTCWTVGVISFTWPATSPWSDTNGWPQKVTLHQQRLAYACTTLNRQTIWMSVAGDFFNFDMFGATAGDADAVTFTLDSGTQNKIQWMTSGKTLNVGTMGNEWTVSGNDRNALTPDNILAQRHTNNGSEDIKPVLIGLATLFVERHGRTTNEFVYDFMYDSYKNTDVTILAPHLTEQYSITEWAYQQTPDGILWCVRSDGDLIGLTYQRDHKVIGWHHHTTEGLFKAIAAIPGETREDDIWVIVNREVDGDAKFYIERLSDWFKGDAAIDGLFLDSWIEYSGTAVDVLTGLDHLEGEEVHILANGTVHPTRTVAGGEIDLDDEYTEVIVGLQYITEIRPYLSDLTGDYGSSVGRNQRVVNVDVNLYNSLGMYVGRDDSEDGEFEEEIPFRVPGDLTGTEVPLFSGIKHLAFPEGFDRKVEYFIRQKQPLPLTVLGVVDSVEIHE